MPADTAALTVTQQPDGGALVRVGLSTGAVINLHILPGRMSTVTLLDAIQLARGMVGMAPAGGAAGAAQQP